MFWPKDQFPARGETPGAWTVEECAAFLSGTYRALLEANGLAVPAWAWVNALAHGSRDDVERLAAGPAGDDSADGYVARLARHARYNLGTEDLTLEELQRGILVPLELALASRLGHATPEQATLSLAVSRELVRGLEPLEAGPGEKER